MPPPEERARARVVTLALEHAESVTSVAAALPDPGDLAPGTLVLVPGRIPSPARSLSRSVLGMFRRSQDVVARALRCSALVARGYVDVGAAEDGAGVAWGYAPRAEDGE